MGIKYSGSENRNGYLVDEAGNAMPIKRKKAVPASSGTNAFITAVAAKKIRVLGYRLQSAGTVTLKFYDTTTPSEVTDAPQWDFQAREGVSVGAPPGCFEFETAAGNGLQINLSGAIAVMVHVIYVEVPTT